MAFNLHYTEKILKKIETSTKKSFLSKRELLKQYQSAFEMLQSENDQKISSNIDNYYISTITS